MSTVSDLPLVLILAGPAGSGQRRRDRARRRRRSARPASSRSRARRIRSAGRRCAARWAARSGCRSPRAARSPRRSSAAREHGVRLVAAVPRGGTPLPDARPARADRHRARRRRGRALGGRRWPPCTRRVTIPMQRAGRVAQRGGRRGAHPVRSDTPATARQRARGADGSVRRSIRLTRAADCRPERAEPRRCRPRRSPSACGRARSTSSSARTRCSRPGVRCARRSSATACSRSSCGARPAPARRRSRASSPSATQAHFVAFSAVLSGIKEIREVMAEAEQARRRSGRPHDPVRRRDPPLQQGAAGRLPAARRGGRHRADRRDHREPVVRGELGAAVALEGVSSCSRSTPAAIVDDPAARARRPRSAASARWTSTAADEALAGIARYANGDARIALNLLELRRPPRRRRPARSTSPLIARPRAEPRRCSTTRPARSTTT